MGRPQFKNHESMANNPIKSSDLYEDDGALLKAIDQLEQMRTVYRTALDEVKKEAAAVAASLRKVNAAQKEGQGTTRKAATAADKLAAAQKRYEFSLSQTARKIEEYKQATREQNNINKLQTRLNNSMEGSYNRLSAQYSLNKIRLNAMSAEQRKNTRTGQELERQTREIYEEMNRLQKATGKNQLQVGRYDMVNQRLIGTLRNLAGAYLGIAAAQQAVRGFYTDTREIDRLDKAYQFVIKDQQEIGESYAWLSQMADDYGVDVLALQETYLKFRTAARETNLTLGQQRAIYQSVIKSSAIVGNTTETTSGILRAFEQILSKGKVQAEELRGQLGDRLPGAFQIMAKSMGVTNAELDKMLEQGQVVADEVLPAFAAELERTFGAENVDRIDNLGAAEGRLRNEQTELVRAFEGSQALSSFLNTVAAGLRAIRNNLGFLKELAKFIALAGVSYLSYRSAVLLTTLAERTRMTGLIRLARGQGIYNAAAVAGRRATIALNTAIKSNPWGLALSLITTVASAWLLYRDNVDEATESQKGLNDELAKTDEMLGKIAFEKLENQSLQFNKASGFSGELNIVSVEEFRKELAKLNKTELQQYRAYFERFIADTERAKENIDNLPDVQRLQFEADVQKAEDFQKFLGLVNKELAVYEKTTTTTGGGNQEPDFDTFDVRAERIRVMEAGAAKEIAQLQLEVDKKRGLWEKYGLDIAILEQFQQREIAAIRDKYRQQELDRMAEAEEERKRRLRDSYDAQLDVIDQQFDLRQSEIDIMKDTEAEKTRLRLQAEKERLQKILELNKGAERQLSDLQLETIRNTIAKIQQEIEAVGNSDRRDIYDMLGLKLNNEQKQAISQSVNYVLNNLQSIMQARITQADRMVEASQRAIDAAQQRLESEINAQRQGYANQVETARRELALAREKEQKALAEREKAVKAQQRLDTIAQTSSLITASANLWKAFAPLGPFGIAAAIGGIATMFGSFVASKVKANQLATQQFGEGGYEILRGGSHASGNDIGLGVNNGRELRAEGGEGMAIFSKKATRKYGGIIPGLVDAINRGEYERKYLNSFNQNLPPSVYVDAGADSPDLKGIERDLGAIRRMNEERITRDANGRTIRTFRNLRQIIK